MTNEQARELKFNMLYLSGAMLEMEEDIKSQKQKLKYKIYCLAFYVCMTFLNFYTGFVLHHWINAILSYWMMFFSVNAWNQQKEIGKNIDEMSNQHLKFQLINQELKYFETDKNLN